MRGVEGERRVEFGKIVLECGSGILFHRQTRGSRDSRVYDRLKVFMEHAEYSYRATYIKIHFGCLSAILVDFSKSEAATLSK